MDCSDIAVDLGASDLIDHLCARIPGIVATQRCGGVVLHPANPRAQAWALFELEVMQQAGCVAGFRLLE
ncbi:hypothetical protein SS50377_27311 [Spironucleus salmonicida]|uniref:Uncharacterized protein n=1 Tax=Spironucleus salmonicida TaxID=348837 RepID=V6LI52_9EUKA|nr:hypothetical protein SS50377_27307 [Spironucleus salmonicida]KAH0571017.1 hypothetical protein SS50377_27311 [Spironucleus salmonicida]|eukprot:EST43387.1 Hypothetical protein SS50377_17067 [Spironucleus salmonicida]